MSEGSDCDLLYKHSFCGTSSILLLPQRHSIIPSFTAYTYRTLDSHMTSIAIFYHYSSDNFMRQCLLHSTTQHGSLHHPKRYSQLVKWEEGRHVNAKAVLVRVYKRP
jgi:hypothetical protein